MHTSAQVISFLNGSGWFDTTIIPAQVRFLAAGEYNENWLISVAETPQVLRINHGSQLGLANQIAYEWAVLHAVAPSGVTPRPYYIDTHPAGLAGGTLLMEYLPGTPLDYTRHSARAAHIFAKIHTCPVPEAPSTVDHAASASDTSLLRQPDPIASIAAESMGLLERYPDHPLRDVKGLLLAHHERVVRLADDHGPMLRKDAQVIVNTEVNSGNFIMHDAGDHLVDWEKAVISTRYQDLAHFLAPTTTLWKTSHLYDSAGRDAFLTAYTDALYSTSGERLDRDACRLCTDVMIQVVLLRGLSWCYMAFHEYTSTRRELAHTETLRTIQRYLENTTWFLR